MNEIWQAIPNYEGLYEISSLGRVRGVDRLMKHWLGGPAKCRGRIRKQARDRTGYMKVILSKNGKTSTEYVHRLVAHAFSVGGHGDEVNHIDMDKQNNAAANLCWCSRLENSHHWRTARGVGRFSVGA
jgi:hypothetical protein